VYCCLHGVECELLSILGWRLNGVDGWAAGEMMELGFGLGAG